MSVRLETLNGPRLTASLGELSNLRLSVFREWPYLYDGDATYEADYLQTFATAPDAMIVGAFDGEEMIGAATAAPLAGHSEAFVPLFEAHGYDPATVFYCGESVLLPPYRGRGLGHAFFDHREAHARQLNAKGARFQHVTFCGVVRSEADPRCPPDYRPLDDFWRKRGFEPVPGITGTYDWRELGARDETPHTMQFWLKTL